ncbi:MAG TPA: type I glutamate--ammonia ligase [Planctomycetota bacterium]|nr:type I glutamate--ammonia ligase [Planctomycetota bacterium]
MPAAPASTNGASRAKRDEVLAALQRDGVKFLRLQFTDILGVVKNQEVPESQFEKALDGEIAFDGSSIEGFVRIEESDMLLSPDFDSYRVLPWGNTSTKTARIVCDVLNPDGSPFDGCPRGVLRRNLQKAAALGYSMNVGPEAEFFLFQKREDGSPTTITHDHAAYFDLAPIDKGVECRQAIVNTLVALGYEVEAAHHEVAPGQHEIDFKYGDALSCADNLTTFRLVVRKVADDFGLHATFMPKPIFGINGSGMHCHQSLASLKDGKNAFYDAKGKYRGISTLMLHYIGGLLEHGRNFSAVTNPIVNSYKRLVPGYEAPTHLAWSERNRSPLIRVPERRGEGTRCELRMPDPSTNPYLAFSVMLAAGLDGVRRKLDPGEPVNRNIYEMSARERARHHIKQLPGNLSEALDCLEKDEVVCEALGNHVLTNFVEAKRQEWQEYIAQVHPWEIDRYLSVY